MFFYETDDEKSFCNRVITALFFEIATAIVAVILIVISWVFLRYADIPVTHLTRDFESSMIDSSNKENFSGDGQTREETSLELSVSVIVYMIAALSFVGWFLFGTFGGVGLSALPIDLILSWQNRPVLRPAKDLAEIKVRMKHKATELIKETKALQDLEADQKAQKGFFSKVKPGSQLRKRKNKLISEIMILDRDYKLYEMETQLEKSNPLVYLGKTILGVICALLSLVLWVHILLYVVLVFDGVPISPFLNKLLILIEEKIGGFFATFAFAGFAMYLLLCVIKGNFKMGLRLFVFFLPIHPMKVNGTWMNSFLFNVLLILLTAVSCVQFCSTAFSLYTRLTTVELLFGMQIKYMRFYKYFYEYNVFIYLFMVTRLSQALNDRRSDDG
jgi:LMBR1 domain-containing protein 1